MSAAYTIVESIYSNSVTLNIG